MHRFFSAQHSILKLSTASRPSPAGSLLSALTPCSVSEFRAATRKSLYQKPSESGSNQESRNLAYEKENPRLGYGVCVSKTPVERLRQLPTDHLSCGKTRAYQNDQSSMQPPLGSWFFSLSWAHSKGSQTIVP
jgi:hypothetical protein